MARTKTLKPSIIKTRSQSRTDSRTIAPAPVAVPTGHTAGTIDRTINVALTPVVTTTAPEDDLFAGRPTTGTLKDPPPAVLPTTGMNPVPRDRDSINLDDDAKKPAAKPKGRRPKATRKPRKPRTDPADDLVDPMANIHFGDDATGVVTAGGGLARAGGNDPVLANPEQEPLDEPQPKKTRRAVDRRRASRANRAGHGDDDDDEDSYSTVGTGTGGYGNGGNGGGDDDDYDDSDPDADSIADSQGVPEAPGVYAPIIIGDTPEERGFSMYLSGPPLHMPVLWEETV